MKHFTKIPALRYIRDLIYETPIEIGVVALAFGIAGGYYTYQHNNAKQGQTPLAFSEIESTIKEYKAKGEPVPPLTLTLSLASDTAMKVHEDKNAAFAKGNTHAAFAEYLEKRVNPALKQHLQITEIAAQMPTEAQRALDSLQKLTKAANAAPDIAGAFSRVWSEYHDHHYKTVYYTDRVCSGTGNTRSCHNVRRSRREHDYTIHHYTYHWEAGDNAARLLRGFAANNPDVNIPERLVLAKETHRDNEAAMSGGLKQKFKDKIPTKAEILNYANTWAKGSNLTKYMPAVTKSHAALYNAYPEWERAKHQAHSTSYRTSFKSDSGPREYRIADQIESYARNLPAPVHKITDGIGALRDQLPLLSSQIENYVEACKAGREESELNKQRAGIFETTHKIYASNFENGFDLNPFKWFETILVTLLITGIGAGVGTGLDKWIDKRKNRGFALDDKPEEAPEEETPAQPEAVQPAKVDAASRRRKGIEL